MSAVPRSGAVDSMTETHEISLSDGFEVALKERGKLEARDGIRRCRDVNVVRLSPEELREGTLSQYPTLSRVLSAIGSSGMKGARS